MSSHLDSHCPFRDPEFLARWRAALGRQERRFERAVLDGDAVGIAAVLREEPSVRQGVVHVLEEGHVDQEAWVECLREAVRLAS